MTPQAECMAWARIAQPFAGPPYRAQNYGPDWSGVENRNGVNVLRFAHRPGAVMADHHTCALLAAEWNRQAWRR